MKKSRVVFALSLLCGTVFGGASEFVPLQQRAQGQALSGASLLNDSIFSNPAASAFTNVYSLDATFRSPKHFATSILDTKTSAVGGALAYYRVPRAGSNDPVQGGRLGMVGRLSENFGLGVLGKIVWGPDLFGTQNRYTDMDIGMTGQFGAISFGVNMNNVLGGNAAMGEKREYGVGARVNWQETMYFSLALNGEVENFKPVQIGAGAEYVSPYYFSLKGGYLYRPATSISYWTTGVSILSPKMSLHYALEIPNQTGASLEHTVGSTFQF